MKMIAGRNILPVLCIAAASVLGFSSSGCSNGKRANSNAHKFELALQSRVVTNGTEEMRGLINYALSVEGAYPLFGNTGIDEQREGRLLKGDEFRLTFEDGTVERLRYVAERIDARSIRVFLDSTFPFPLGVDKDEEDFLVIEGSTNTTGFPVGIPSGETSLTVVWNGG